MTKRTPRKLPTARPTALSVTLDGDERLAEDLILEFQAIAERHGLEIAETRVVRQCALGTRTAKVPRASKPAIKPRKAGRRR